MRRISLLALIAWLAALAASVPATAQTSTVLGSGGSVYRLLRGTCGALGVCPATANPGHTALALERDRPGKATERFLVPDTEGVANESYPSLAIDRTSDRVFLVWEATESIHSTLRLANFAAGEWSEVFEVAGDSFSFKRNPRLAVTHDKYSRLGHDGEVVAESRLVLHVVWWDEAGSGSRPLYTALVVQDGEVLTDWHTISLVDLLPEASETGGLPASLFQAPQVRTVGAGSRVLVAFGDPIGGRIATLEVDVVGGDVVSFADYARAQVIDIGRRNPAASRQAIAQAASSDVKGAGRQLFTPEVASFLAERFLDSVAESDPDIPIAIAVDAARAQVIDIGRRLREGLQLSTAGARAQVIDIGRRMDASESGSSHLAGYRLASVWPAPWVPERAIRMLTSDNGVDVALAWDADGAVKYRQLEGDGWSEIRTLALDAELTRDQAYALIEHRLQQR